MGNQFSLVSNGKRFGPASFAEVKKYANSNPPSNCSEVIIHSRIGDRRAPISAFPELRKKKSPTDRISEATCPYCDKDEPQNSEGKLTCNKCGCRFEVDLNGEPFNVTEPANRNLKIIGIIGLTFCIPTILGYGATWLALGLLVTSLVNLTGALKYGVVHVKYGKSTAENSPFEFFIGVLITVILGAIGGLLVVFKIQEIVAN